MIPMHTQSLRVIALMKATANYCDRLAPAFENKLLLEHSFTRFSHILYDYFCTTTVELNTCHRDLWREAETLLCPSKKTLLTPAEGMIRQAI